MEKTGKIYGINGPVIYIKGKTDFKMGEMVYVSSERLVGEVISLTSEMTPYRFMKKPVDLNRVNLFMVQIVPYL